MNTFWRNDQPSMPIFHFFLCIFYKAQLDTNNPGYHGNQMSFWNFKACFAVWGSYLLHTQRMRKIPDVACRTPMGIFWFLQRIHVKMYDTFINQFSILSFLWDRVEQYSHRSYTTYCDNGVSDQDLNYLLTECSVKIWKKMLNTTQHP